MNDEVLSLAQATALLTAPGSMFETERVSVSGVEMTVWKQAPATLRQVLDLSLNHATRDFLVYEGQRFTFDEHYRAASTLAARLVAHGVSKGDRVAIASRNLPQWVIAFWGVVVTGAVVVPINAWWTPDELAYGLSDSGASIAFVDEERLERIRNKLDDLPELSSVVVISEDPSRPARLGAAHPRVRVVDFNEYLGDISANAVPPEVDISTDDDATMFYTSGTTGHPKGAVGTHRNAITNLMNLFFVGARAVMRFGGGNVDETGESIPNAGLLSVPLFHATGCLATMITNTASGGKLVMMHHFDAGQALALIESERLTMFGGVPTIAMQILDHPDFTKFDTSSVKSVSYGGAPAPPELVRRIQAAFPTGQPGNGYGLTETSAAVCLNAGADYVAKPDSCGPPLPVVEVAIIPEDFDGGEPTSELASGPGVVGELWIKGPNVVRGYWNKPEETAKAFIRGWLRSGDIARIDDEGFVFIVDRAKDMIIRGGENVYSIVVEAAIFDHPDVADCAVVGLPHRTMGEEVAAVIVLRPGRVIEAEEITRHVANHLARFQVPTRIFFRADPLPRNPQGKILKRELRSSLVEQVKRSA
ncbi:MAG TPA: class I adenylate-forming enzyme family protein [Acidimicrobiales bacterium]|nr:class I adenylate-forming enzyme family protein [Acidimicrobiales bacterium]